MIIRKIKSTDAKAALELCREAREHHREILGGYFAPLDDDFELAELKAMPDNEKLIGLVAEDAGKLCGLLVAEWRTAVFLEKPEIGYIHNFVTAKSSRGKGIGRSLMDAFTTECKKRGVDEIKLGVFNANETAYRFYEHYGFVPQEQKMSLKVNND